MKTFQNGLCWWMHCYVMILWATDSVLWMDCMVCEYMNKITFTHSRLVFFSFNTLLSHFTKLLDYVVCKEKSNVIIKLFPLWIRCFYLLCLQSRLSFAFGFLQFDYDINKCLVFLLEFFCLLSSEFAELVVSCLFVILQNSQSLLLQIFLLLVSLFFLLLAFALHICYSMCNFTTVHTYSVPLFHIFFHFCLVVSLAILILPSATSSLLMSLSRHSSFSPCWFLFLAFFHRLYISLLKVHTCSCMFSLFHKFL